MDEYLSSEERILQRNFNRDWPKLLAALLIIIGGVIAVVFIVNTRHTHHIVAKGEAPNLADSGQFGDFIGGVVGTLFSLVGVILLYKTLKDQRENFHRERLESNFFEMIRFHRENINEIKYSYHDPKVNQDPTHRVTAERRKVFRLIFNMFKEISDELEPLFNSKDEKEIYKENYLNALKKNNTLIIRRIDLKFYARLDITYLMIFFGVGKEGAETIQTILFEKYDSKFLRYVIDFAGLKPKKESGYWSYWERNEDLLNSFAVKKAILSKRDNPDFESDALNSVFMSNLKFYHHPYYKDDYDKYYGGHQFRLGHYYRHLFQTVRFIDKEELLSYKEKYNYIKILRGQLSTYEQIMLFFNSLSSIGRTWELENRHSPSQEIQINIQLITKYNLIKNIPNDEIIPGLKLSSFYPYVGYETFQNSTNTHVKEDLVKNYY